MPLPKELLGLHRFIARDGKVILQTNGVDVLELDFINFLDDPKGIMRAKFKSIEYRNGQRIETPVDIFLRDFKFQDFQVQLSGAERASKTSFALTFGFMAWQREWRVFGTLKDKAINISKKDPKDLLTELIKALK